ncbi:FAD-binding oxidoreductase [Aquabacterium sp. OR-4]|uniref:FAD-binding oxidoreductase n=1 Tax=Aquabacterium sp. OR-4 TaxID=2978127 RepID=UPI0021B38A82|nr:FAD-binding oxidoreductase [Aquabacterium sp. OR-4]MDT7835171.1 FAD-binding oxidoreductase [Aquabacterium sp. OR-4]
MPANTPHRRVSAVSAGPATAAAAAPAATAAARPLNRRTLLALALAEAGGLTLLPPTCLAAEALVPVGNVTGLFSVMVARVQVPRSAHQVARALADWPGTVAVGGGRYSMGGQVAAAGGLHLDMRAMNALVWLRPDQRSVRVQAGMRWRELQDHLDPLGLAVKTMQSFSNFTVGGSVSVNVHGRYVGHGPIGHSVRALQLVLADGQVVEASPGERAELFRAAIGGYGAVGVITEVELDLAENRRITREVRTLALADYAGFFAREVLADPDAVLHNADLLPPDFEQPVAITWRRAPADMPLTEAARLVPVGQAYGLERQVVRAVTEWPGGATLHRQVLHPLLTRGPAVKWLNHEASRDVAQLEPASREHSTYVLQEYFVPPAQWLPFVRAMAGVLRRHRVRALNISIRHSPADRVSLLPWAPQAVFSLVLYYKQRTDAAAIEAVARWTRELVDQVLAHGGRWYLPYQLHATRAQFERAYPEVAALRRVKRSVDPAGRLGNELWRRYL